MRIVQSKIENRYKFFELLKQLKVSQCKLKEIRKTKYTKNLELKRLARYQDNISLKDCYDFLTFTNLFEPSVKTYQVFINNRACTKQRFADFQKAIASVLDIFSPTTKVKRVFKFKSNALSGCNFKIKNSKNKSLDLEISFAENQTQSIQTLLQNSGLIIEQVVDIWEDDDSRFKKFKSEFEKLKNVKATIDELNGDDVFHEALKKQALIVFSFGNLKNFNLEVLTNFVDVFMFGCNFEGSATIVDKKKRIFDLENVKDLYKYLKYLKNHT